MKHKEYFIILLMSPISLAHGLSALQVTRELSSLMYFSFC